MSSSNKCWCATENSHELCRAAILPHLKAGDWLTLLLAEAIPPAFTEYVGGLLLGYMLRAGGVCGCGYEMSAYELETVASLADTPDFAEGVDAFLAKRPPVWPRG